MRVLSMGTISSCLLVAIDCCVYSWRNYFARTATLVEGEGVAEKKKCGGNSRLFFMDMRWNGPTDAIIGGVTNNACI